MKRALIIINFSRTLSLIVGIHGGASARNYNLFIPKENFTPPQSSDYIDNGAVTRVFDFYLSAPLLLETRFFNSDKQCWNLFAGVNVRFYPDEFSEGTSSAIYNGSQYITIYRQELEVGHDFKPWLNYNMGGGYNWVLKNNNMLRLNVILNLSFTDLAAGTYTIEVPGKPVSGGTYASNLSYAGLSVGYLFTGTNKRLNRIYEKQLRYR